MKPAVAFGANSPAEVSLYIDQCGAWTRCLTCKEMASKSRKDPAPSPSANTPLIDPEGLVCQHCKLRRPLYYYKASTLKNRNRDRKQTCNVCNGATFCVGCTQWKPNSEFRRSTDRCNMCQSIQCTTCGEEKKTTEYIRSHVYNYYSRQQNIQCRVCHESGTKTKASINKTYNETFCRVQRCRVCGEDQQFRAFRHKNGKRIDVCKKCELLPCTACSAMLPDSKFPSRDANNFFWRGGTIICLDCRKKGCSPRHPESITCTGPCKQVLPISAFPPILRRNAKREKKRMICKKCIHAKETRLRELMKRSKRKGCTCKSQFTHTEKCPMHISFAGERPYPGCDVMSKEDSEWLHQRGKRRKE